MNRIQELWKTGRGKVIIIGGGLAFLLLCCCIGIFAIPTPKPASPAITGTLAGPAATSVPAATSAPTATAVPSFGESRDNPYPLGSQVDIGSDLILTVGTIIRPADKNVHQYNMFNSTPEPGQEYLQVELQLHCTKSSSDTCSLILLDVKAVGGDGQIHDREYIAGIPNELDTTGEMFGGATVKGNLVYSVPKGDATVVLFVDPFLGSKIYLAIQ